MKYLPICTEPTVIRPNLNISGATFVEIHEYSAGNKVPIYLIDNTYALNELIGYTKYINRDFGSIVYRGECKLHNTLQPSMQRNISSQKAWGNANHNLNRLLCAALNDTKFIKTVSTENAMISKLILEGMLQHYGVPTRFIDIVNNHWIALWFGLYSAKKINSIKSYVHFQKRKMDYETSVSALKNPEIIYQYLILVASNNCISNLTQIDANKETVTVDLRAALPPTFLRPHAQHGFVIRKLKSVGSNKYDMSNHIVGIIKIRIDYVDNWIGSGTLLSLNNLFPSPAFDLGYDLLLNKSELFSGIVQNIAY